MKEFWKETEINILAVFYFVQQNFTDWKGAKQFATFILRDGWK
jgi:hypothetical protein